MDLSMITPPWKRFKRKKRFNANDYCQMTESQEHQRQLEESLLEGSLYSFASRPS